MTVVRQRRVQSMPQRACVLAVLLFALVPRVQASASDDLKVAKNNYEYGDFAKTVQILAALPDITVLPLESERIEAYRLLGLAEFFLGHKPQAENAFFGLLKQNPDYTLDPFYVPPDAVAFFDDVKRQNDEYLAPIRERRRARIREQQAEDAARKEAERRRTETQKTLVPPTVVVEQRVRENSRLIASMPFGLGQFQNGYEGAGTLLAFTQALSAITSIAAYGLIETLRDETRGGTFVGRDYDTALTLETVKYVSGGLFYVLWLAGAAEANVSFVPSLVVASSSSGGAPPVLSPVPAGTPAPGVTNAPAQPPRAPAPPPPAALPDSIRDAVPPATPAPSLVPVSPTAPPAPASLPRADEPVAPPEPAADPTAQVRVPND